MPSPEAQDSEDGMVMMYPSLILLHRHIQGPLAIRTDHMLGLQSQLMTGSPVKTQHFVELLAMQFAGLQNLKVRRSVSYQKMCST
jgi:hypothetical protein